MTGQPATPDDGEARGGLEAARAELDRAVTIAGLTNDPIRHLLAASSAGLGAFVEGIDAMRRLASPIFVERIEAAAATAAERRAAQLARAHNGRTLLIYGGAFVAGALVAAWIGYGWGWAAGSESVKSTERRLGVAYQDGPAAAAAWATVMENNDIVRALGQCVGPRAYADASGRKACLLPIYIEPPRRGPPFEVPH